MTQTDKSINNSVTSGGGGGATIVIPWDGDESGNHFSVSGSNGVGGTSTGNFSYDEAQSRALELRTRWSQVSIYKFVGERIYNVPIRTR